jgi:hypothetical protein
MTTPGKLFSLEVAPHLRGKESLLADAFRRCLIDVEETLGQLEGEDSTAALASREMAICRTELQAAFFFAVMSLAHLRQREEGAK